MHHINYYKSDTNVEVINPKNMRGDVNIWSPVIYLCVRLNIGKKVYNQICTENLTLIHIGHAHEIFND